MTDRKRRRGGRLWFPRRTRRRVLVLTCLLTAALGLLALSGNTAASGSGGAVTFTPQEGPAGTQVSVTIVAEPPGPTPYLLGVSPTDPAANNCADGVAPSDGPKIVVIPGQPTTTTISWPAAFISGAYYLCASPAAGQKGPTVWSQQPFVVTSGTSGSPPGSLSAGATSGVVAEVSGGSVVAGSTFTLSVDADAALAANAPGTIMLQEPVTFASVQVHWALVTRDGPVYTYAVTVPVDTPPGTYEVQVIAGNGATAATSNRFQVVSSAAVSRGGSHSLPPGTARPASPMGTLLVAAIALLLALGAASLAAPLLRRPRRGRDAH